MDLKSFIELAWGNCLFWLSRKIDYPLLPPDFVQINFTFECNLRCRMCNMQNHSELLKSRGERVEIDSDTIKKIIRESAGLQIKNALFLGGEPFLREDLFDLVSYASHFGLAVIIITNGVLLNKEVIENCLSSGVDCLNISIDAARQGTFAKIRGEAVLGKIISNIDALNALKGKKNIFLPKLSATCTIVNDNLEELLEITHLCRKLKFGNISFQPAVINNVEQSERGFSPGIIIPPSRLRVLDEYLNKLIDYKRENPDFIINTARHLELIKKYFRGALRAKEVWPCYAGYNRLQITQDYVMYFCIPLNDKHKSSFGDVSKDSLSSLWYSKTAKIRRKLIRGCGAPCLQFCSYRYEFGFFSRLLRGCFGK